MLALGSLVAKALVVSFVFAEASFARRAWLTLRVLPLDLLVIGGASALALLPGRRLRVPRRLRIASGVALVLASQFLLFATFANVEFFGSWGSPLTFELLRLAPNLAGYILLVGVSNVSGTLTIWALLALAGLLGLPLLQSRCATPLRSRRGLSARRALTAAALVTGGAVAALTPREYREATLRELNLLTLFLPGWQATRDVAASPLSAGEEATLRRLVGPADESGSRALAPLRGRRPNVVLWIWESVGAREIASLHPLGEVRTPSLDRIVRAGSVSFRAAYAECPLTVQSTWAILTGLAPPAKPFVFVDDRPLPAHGPSLQGEMRRAGYRTAAFYASFTRMWGTRRLFEMEPFDVFEDAEAFAARGSYASSGIGIQDDAIVDRGLEWVAGLGDGERFFLLLWNTETHRPYTWAGMPADLRDTHPHERFRSALERSDALLGRLYEGLAAKRLLEETVIVVVGDHGEAFGRGARGWHFGHGSQVYEDEVHVPLVIAHPALEPKAVDAACGHADLLPTLLDIVGRGIPDGLGGRSLARRLEPAPLFMRATLWWPLAIRAGSFKLVLTGPRVAPSLYDLAADPEERYDVSGREPEVAKALTSALLLWHSNRFRTDPTFGYQMPGLSKLIGGSMDAPVDQWIEQKPAPSPAPATPR